MKKDKEVNPGVDIQEVKDPVSADPPKLPVSATPPDTRDIDSLRELAQSSKGHSGSDVIAAKPQKLSEKAERIRTLKLENDGAEKDQDHKGKTLNRLFRLLYGETTLIFVLTFLQGFKWHGFNLDNWTLRVVVTATLGQITAMLLIAVRHLFPEKKN